VIKENRPITRREFAVKIGISQGHVIHIIYIVGYQTICARWVPHMLTAEVQVQGFDICQQLFSLLEESEAFLHTVVTAEETWVHHYESETKSQSMEYHHRGSSKKKSRTQALVEKLKATVFGCSWRYSRRFT
jgi:hypothetical protein